MVRPAGAGVDGVATTFMRSQVSPRAALVISAAVEGPDDWPSGDGSIEATLGHAVGWTCEVRRDDLVLLNPLGEGLVKAPLPALPADWLDNVRHDGSCALFLVPTEAESGFAELSIAAAASTSTVPSATVRTSVAEDAGKQKPVGRNDPCPCGSGKKSKHCCG